MTEPRETLYVIYKEDDKQIYGNYTEDEISFLIDETLEFLMEDIQRNYSIQEQLENHIITLGKLANYYQLFQVNMTDNKDLNNYLKLYNKIAPDKLGYEMVEIDVCDEAIAIAYICDNGLEEFKRSNFIKNQALV